jgi:riboflavin synthase
MFTGLIEGIGTVRSVVRKRGSIILSIAPPGTIKTLKVNDSISVDGVCLTVIRKTKKQFAVQAVEETLLKSALGGLKGGSRVNLERSLAAHSRLGGHFVLGHVDCIGEIQTIERRKSSWLFHVQFPRKFSRYIIPVGSIAVNGVSLTVASRADRSFAVSIIPHTMTMTTFQSLEAEDNVNIEFDVLGKYVEQLLLTSGKRK